MRIIAVLSIAAFALTAGAIVERAKAEQAFLCDGGRIVYAHGAAELERLKASDACVAGYFGQSTLRASGRAETGTGTPTLRSEANSGPSPVASTARPKPVPEVSSEPVTVRVLNARSGADTWSPDRK